MKYVKKTILTLLFPVLMFLVMLAITASDSRCYVDGNFIFLGEDLVRYIIMNSCMTICVALAIWLQLKNGRFDFSGGASMLLAAIIAGNIGYNAGSPLLAMIVAVGVGIVLSCVTGGVYVLGRMPIIITTIGMTLLYESLTYLVFGGKGMIAFYLSAETSMFGRVPWVFVPTLIAIIVFLVFDHLTAAGRKGKILANNQSAGVNIGINEKKNVLVSYVFTGIIIGMAATVYVSQNSTVPQSGLSTSGILFSYIVPVFMGMFIGQASNDVIGICVSAVGLSIMNYGLNCLNLGAGGWQQIIMGAFVLGFYAFEAKLPAFMQIFEKMRKRTRAAT
ncbi:MAG: hypothetical protein IJ662_06355 [Clostridia bacterium]|nr:hypothetical protein [Clostridia bacterium]